MQISIEIPDKLAKELKSKYTKSQQKEILKEIIEKNIKKELKHKKDPFIEWLMKPVKSKNKARNISEKHNKYIYI